MRKALIVGINEYAQNPLSGCVSDAESVAATLEANGDGSPNFENHVLTDADATRTNLRREIEELFDGDADIALFYFSGHGTITSSGGVIVTQDSERFDEGITMTDIVNIANQSTAKNKVIVLDCCYSGSAGTSPVTGSTLSELNDGLTILTASRPLEEAVEDGDGGVFTSLLVEALQGGASDIRGNITPGTLYSYIDEALGAWEQRPIFKTNVSSFAVLRRVSPRVELSTLRKISTYFPTPTSHYNLDPSYEPERSGAEPKGTPEPDKNNNEVFAELQAMNRASLIVPVDAPHMWHAAMESKACRLTAMGKQYWRLANERKI